MSEEDFEDEDLEYYREPHRRRGGGEPSVLARLLSISLGLFGVVALILLWVAVAAVLGVIAIFITCSKSIGV